MDIALLAPRSPALLPKPKRDDRHERTSSVIVRRPTTPRGRLEQKSGYSRRMGPAVVSGQRSAAELVAAVGHEKKQPSRRTMMPTALETRGQPPPVVAPLPRRATEPTRPALRIRLTADVAKHLGRNVSAIMAKLRAEFDTHRRTDDLVIDLSDATEVPVAQLLLLVTMSRHIIGHAPTITLSGVRPMVLGPLTAYDLPDNVVVVDARGRQWTNTPDERPDPRPPQQLTDRKHGVATGKEPLTKTTDERRRHQDCDWEITRESVPEAGVAHYSPVGFSLVHQTRRSQPVIAVSVPCVRGGSGSRLRRWSCGRADSRRRRWHGA